MDNDILKDVLHELADRMDKTIDSFRHDLLKIRTGRASPTLVESLSVEYYGSPTPLQQLASISIPEPQQILIRPYAAGDIPAIEKAIAKSDLGLTPNNDGKQIRLNIPPLTEERRRALAKQIHIRAEEARIAIRNIRRDSIQYLREFEKEGDISEDDLTDGEERTQKTTDEHIRRVEEIAHNKEAEVMKV
jgi:ribosome recycling factor